MRYDKAEFKAAYGTFGQLPDSDLPEIAFAGRSNVGKSSLLNRLFQRKNLARVSSVPGKTITINFYQVEDTNFVDLPGYGYARVSRDNRAVWGKMIRTYILKRENLLNVYLLIDSRHLPQKIDIEFMNFLGENSVPFTIVFTKIDKQTANKTNENLRNYKNELLKYWEELPQIILTSAEKRQGLEELMDSIKSIIPYYNK